MQLAGAITAIVTPFKNGKVDEEGFRELIEWQISEGINGLVPCGTTGESATLTHEEHEQVIKICVEQTKKRVPVIAGAGSNNTAEAIRLTRFAKEVGADAALSITPYYNKPTQEGLYQHFKAIAREVSIPTVLYNVPGRTALNVTPQTMARIHKDIPDVFAVKEASGNLDQYSQYMEFCGPSLTLLVGDDFTVLPSMILGGKGVISVVSNLVPRMMADMCKAFFDGDYAKARELHYKMSPLNRACFIETNPIPVKTGVHMMGKIGSGELRLPMCPPSADTEAKLRKVMTEAGLL